MEIVEHRLRDPGVDYVESPNQGGPFAPGQPDTIIIHYTDGGSAAGAVETLCDVERKVSAHLVVGRQGSVTQLLPFDTIGWHAGRSRWKGREAFNQYSLGIEIDNAGQLRQQGDQYIAWFGRAYPEAEVVQAQHPNQSEPAYWHRFPQAQLQLVEDLCRLLMSAYGIRFILGHDEIAPDRKIDPGPAFPLEEMRRRLGAIT